MTESLLDLDRLNAYLQSQLPHLNRIECAEKFNNGQSNPTFLLSGESGQLVLRRQPPGELLKSAHAVDREYRVIKALQDSRVPVPRALHLCVDRDVIGSLFFLMSFEAGQIFWDPTLPDLDVAGRAAIYSELNRVLAALHSVDVEAVGLADFGRPGDYFERQISRWSRQYRACETETIPAMNRLIDWLPQHLPADDGQVSLIHGDFRIDNIVFMQTGNTARALLDWELSTLGHPYADLAYQCMQWRVSRDAVIPGLGDLDRQSIGIPSEQDYVAEYCARRGLDSIDHWNFYLAFSFFRMAAILQGVLKRALDGNASSTRALEYGALAPELAAMALELTD